MEPLQINHEIAKEWITALRTGKVGDVEFCQSKMYLHNSEINGRCCLGVLCDLYMSKTGDGVWNGDSFVLGTIERADIPPDKVIEWAGMHADLYLDYDFLPFLDGITAGLAGINFVGMNDDTDIGFIGIADAIEKAIAVPPTEKLPLDKRENE